ncbi:MAG: DEAD/DEAH box helicase [Deltaproteobacteria bacterium]|nr:DEAD/DEAH box helicase [Deltaproteobacteria bacterium]
MRQDGGIDAVMEAWSERPMSSLVRARLEIPVEEARTARTARTLSREADRALEQLGIERLYTHQAEAVDHVLEGRNVVVATPTASGKSLCYQLPIIEQLAHEPDATALLIFPTKALEHDQGKELGTLVQGARIDAALAAYDGDATSDARRLARSRARIVLTNPDMLHMGVLPHHTSWSSFLAGLKIIVIDELHQYRGVFGSHFANVLRRLGRVLDFHGARPVWLASSATIRNPKEMAETLVGRAFELVSRSGAPSGKKSVYFMTPPLVNPVAGVRGSYMHLAARAAHDLVRAGLQTLVFAGSRRAVEVLLRYVRERVRGDGLEPEAVQGYRGGYLPALRRRIEDGLKQGSLRCVIATNALELGVDIGSLDAVVLAGYPGSVASTWQRIGRAGRRRAPSLAALVCSASPLDQFIVEHADYLSGAPPERGLLNPDNLEILLEHIKCAAFELAFEPGEGYGGLQPEETGEVMDHLAKQGLVHATAGRHMWVADEFPGASVNLRSIGSEPFVITDATVSSVIGEVDGRNALRMLHEQAVYQHAGLPYIVEKLDIDRRRATVREVEPEYYTQPVVSSSISPIDVIDRTAYGQVDVHLGEVRIIERITGFKKIRFGSHENLGYGDVDLPETKMEAFSVWIDLSRGGMERISGTLDVDPVSSVWVAEALEGLGSLTRHIAALRLMCDPHDLVPSLSLDGADPSEETRPAIFIHEAHPGGVGLVEKLYEQIMEISIDALDALARCPCTSGCPSCVGPPEREDTARKRTVRAILEFMAPDVH